MSTQLEAALKTLAGQGVTPEDFQTTAEAISTAIPPQTWSSTTKSGQPITLTKNSNTTAGEESYNVEF